MKILTFIVLLLSLVSQAISQEVKTKMRKATPEEIKELIPIEVLNSAKEHSNQVGPYIRNEVAQKNLLDKYYSSTTSEEFLKTKNEFKQYYQKLVNEGQNKNSLIKFSNKINIDMYDNLLNKKKRLETEIQKNIEQKQSLILKKHNSYLSKWNLSTEEISHLSEDKRQEYLSDEKQLKMEENKLLKDISDYLKQSKTLKEVKSEAKKFQDMLKSVVAEVDYTDQGSIQPEDIKPQVTKVEVLVPKNFNLEGYKLRESQYNGNFSILTDQKDIQPLCYKNTTSTNDMGLFFNNGQDVLDKLIENENKELKGKIYFSWGYNRAWHSKSDVTFSTSEGTFTIHDAHGDDRPSPFDPKVYFNPAKMSIPQYNLKLGYQFNDRWALEGGTDHMKWVFDNQRKYDISGDFSAKVVVPNPNSQHGWDAVMPVDFDEVKESGDVSWLGFEHSDGYNYVHLTGVFNQKVFETKNKIFALSAQIGAGAGLMVPKTKVNMHRDQAWNWEGLDNRFHVAGAGVHGDVRLKMTFYDRVFIQGVARGNAIKVKNALVNTNKDPGARLEHTPIYSGQISVEIGANFPLYKKKKLTNIPKL
jgi:hypothetical protein